MNSATVCFILIHAFCFANVLSDKSRCYIDHEQPTGGGKQMRCAIEFEREDGRSMDQVFRAGPIKEGDMNYNFTDIASEITSIDNPITRGPVRISENGLADLANLRRMYIRDYAGTDHLDIHPNAFLHTPNLTAISVDNIKVTENTLRAFTQLKDQLVHVHFEMGEFNEPLKFNNSKEILEFIAKCTRLQSVILIGFKNDGPTPAEVFRRSASTLQWININQWPVVSIKADTFRNMPRLKRISWVNSGLTTIEPGALDEVPELSGFSILNNNIRLLPHGLFENTRKLEKIFVKDNPLENLSRENFTHVENFGGFFYDVTDTPVCYWC